VKYVITSVDKFHGPNKGSEVVDLAKSDLASVKALGAALRRKGVLCKGQAVRSMRGPIAWELGEPLQGTLNGQPCLTHSPYADNPIPESAIIVFPRNVPGLTTGFHSLTLIPVKGGFAFGSGMHGCLYDHAEGPFESVQAAAESASQLFELAEDSYKSLQLNSYLELPKDAGAQYVEIFAVDADWESGEA
jgi:hypothetical protein